MKIRYITGFVLVFFLSACTSLINLTPTVAIQQPPVDVQPGMEKTEEYFAVQTIVAHEQITDTPTPETLSNPAKPWTEITIKTATPTPTSTPHSAIASAVLPMTSILLGPAYNSYRIACYVNEGVQLMITGRNIDSSWLKVTFGQGQTCFISDKYSNRVNIIPDPNLQFWIFSSTCTVSGDLSEVAIITPTVTPSPTPVRPTPTP